MPPFRQLPRLAGVRSVVWILLAAAGAGLLALTPALTAGAGAFAAGPRASSPQDGADPARTTCGGCHAVPPPDILPRDMWRDEFVRMMFIRENRQPPLGPPGLAYRGVQLPPDMEQLLPSYLAGAPERLPAPERWPEPGTSPLSFERRSLTMRDMPGTPAVSHVQLVDMDGDKRPDILGTDMRQGVVFVGRPGRDPAALSAIASIPHPAHVTVSDVDRDGIPDLLVAEMGEFFPADHAKGAVIWMRGQANGRFGAFWLDGWPRVAAIDVADFNGDGVPDLSVAAFGWRKTGQLAVLENRTSNPVQPSFTTHTIDPRPGSIEAVPVDFNRDGRMDLVTLLAQEHETVLAYINQGTPPFTFDRKVIYAAPHPNWGSSGFQVVDLDRDGDLDVVLAHGDTFDDGVVKPYHGIQWLENTGGYPFVERTLARMPGVHGIKAADLDGDGDLDIAASALLAAGSDVDEKTLPALVWLEQTRPGVFERHTIEMGFPRHAALDVGDVDGDGDADLVVGNFSIEKSTAGWVDVWVNGGRK